MFCKLALGGDISNWGMGRGREEEEREKRQGCREQGARGSKKLL
ncbi:hypothetical protein NSP_52280 [Nodularia spumigena CCY9414]|nr:hypothetical protein NSP_52280 [Nodularia spumigena CCY9414]